MVGASKRSLFAQRFRDWVGIPAVDAGWFLVGERQSRKS